MKKLAKENEESPIEKQILNAIGVYLVIVFILCVLLNTLLLVIFARFKKMRTSLNKLILVLTVFNLFGSIQFPFVIQSNFIHRWIWGHLACIFCGYVIYFVGCMQVFLMSAISFIRFDILNKQKNEKSISRKTVLTASLISFLMSFFWSTAPIFGWSYYSLEDGLVSCSVEYNDKSLNVVSYNIGMLVFVYIIPLAIIIITNMKSLIILRTRRKMSPHLENLKLLSAENKITISMLIYIGGFVITWTPYSLVLLVNSFKNTTDSWPIASTLSAVFAISSVVWSTSFYLITNKNIKSNLKRLFCRNKSSRTGSFSLETNTRHESRYYSVNTESLSLRIKRSRLESTNKLSRRSDFV